MLYYILLTATLHRMGLCRCESLATFRHHLHWGYQLGAHHERRWEETTYKTAARDDCFWTSFVYIVVRFYLYFCMLYFVCSTCRFTFFKWGVIMIHDISCYYSLCNWNYSIWLKHFLDLHSTNQSLAQLQKTLASTWYIPWNPARHFGFQIGWLKTRLDHPTSNWVGDIHSDTLKPWKNWWPVGSQRGG